MQARTLLLLTALAAGPAHADPARDALAEIAKCAEIADAAERLKCFDAAMPRAKSALAEPAPAPEASSKSLLEWFGFSRPQKPVTKAEDFGKAPTPAAPVELNEVTATVTEFAKTARGKAIFILDNGQVWRQLDADSTELPYLARGSPPMKVTIEIGVFSSYNLTIEGRNGLIKVTRLK